MNLLYLTILFPLLGFLLLAFSRGRWSENTSATVGVGSIGLAALVTSWVVVDFMGQQHGGVTFFNQHLWTWMAVGNFDISVTLTLDGLAVTMLSVVTGVGFFIHLFASGTCVGKRIFSFLRLHQPVYREYGRSGTGR